MYSHYFNTSASVSDNIQTKGNAPFNFVNDFPGNYLEDLRKPFKLWATKRLPSESSTFNHFITTCVNRFLALDPSPDEVQPRNVAEPTILYRTNGFPLLPAINFDTISPTSGRSLLTAYILSVWGKFLIFQHALI